MQSKNIYRTVSQNILNSEIISVPLDRNIIIMINEKGVKNCFYRPNKNGIFEEFSAPIFLQNKNVSTLKLSPTLLMELNYLTKVSASSAMQRGTHFFL